MTLQPTGDRRQAPPPMLTTAEVARRLSISAEGVRLLVLRGDISAKRIGRKLRFDQAEFERYLDAATER